MAWIAQILKKINVNDFLDLMKQIQRNLLDFLDNEEESDEDYRKLLMIFDNLKILDDKHTLNLLLHLISRISNNHHRGADFFNKIDKILQHFKESIKKFYSNYELFNIFKDNKRILLLLIEGNLFILDEKIVKYITIGKYKEQKFPQYFAPEK